MQGNAWPNKFRNTVLCIDSYMDGVLKGRLFNPYTGGKRFESMMQFLLEAESMLDSMDFPQSHTANRSFSTAADIPAAHETPTGDEQRGALATFRLWVRFRQHASWQGTLTWLEEGREESFRSVLELILLMDSALRETGGTENSPVS